MCHFQFTTVWAVAFTKIIQNTLAQLGLYPNINAPFKLAKSYLKKINNRQRKLEDKFFAKYYVTKNGTQEYI